MIVMKFGGTSVGSAERILNVAKLVKDRLAENPVVVVSAVGGVTDLLLRGGESALKGNIDGALPKIREIHEGILKNLNLKDLNFEAFWQELQDIYKGILFLKEFTPRTKDLVASFGERISARILASCLKSLNVDAKAFDAWDVGFITNSDYTHARLLPEASEKIKNAFAKITGVPVVTGFIAKSKDGDITTLGRGGSDFTASLLGAALNVSSIEIWTDVSGIMTADPRLVPQARSLPLVSFQEAAELSYFGAKILHPKTIEPAMKKKIPVFVKNTFEPTHPGTKIVAEGDQSSGMKAVTLKQGITVLNLYSTGMLDAHGFLSRIFSIFDKHQMSIDVIATSEVNVSLTLDTTQGLEQALPELSEFAEVQVAPERTIVCLVGEGLKETPGIAGRAFHILGKAGINIEMISQGASQVNLTCIVKKEDGQKAVQALHKEFFEEDKKIFVKKD
jgi:aspartate kinase